MTPFSISHTGRYPHMFLNPSVRPHTVRPTMSTTACYWPQDGSSLATARSPAPCWLSTAELQVEVSHPPTSNNTEHTCRVQVLPATAWP